MTDRLQALAEAGVAIWIDDVSRQRLSSGNLAELVHDKHVVGVTSNPTIFSKALADADEYAEQTRDLAIRGVDVEEAVRALTTYDIRWACDVLRPAYDASGGVDGRVSIEVDPRLARDTERTIAEARALWWLVDRPNLFIKIPATREGLPAITAALAEGISVNVTLIFAIQRYREVMDAFLTGLEQAKANGHDLATIGSVASFFVSRVDTEVDKRLDKLGSDQGKGLRGKAAIANARLAFEAYEEVFGVWGRPQEGGGAGDRWQALEAAGAKPQRPLWASTSTKDPSLPDTIYVTELVTAGVVNTMPEATINAFDDHGEVHGDTVRGRYAEAREVINDLDALGISYDDVVRVLEDEGVEKFAASWKEVLDTVGNALEGARQ
ncbi:transaldolase [Actinopolymorpha alba]|uniref:transaldolase n=1 Tax=Actinopolymorpha alba TaxID=533267 RepID=UPI0003A65EAD|nr:transaldolase [Actinopolymorpha alba]